MRNYWLELATQIDVVDRRRQKIHTRWQERMKERARKTAEGQSTHNVILKRDTQRRFNCYPWASADLDELATIRCISGNQLAATIIENVTDLWQRYPHDEVLYLKRCEDPFEAEAVVALPSMNRPYIANLDSFESHDLRTFGHGAIRCLQRGIRVEDLQRELESIASAVREMHE